ncbi:MAG: D-2-hydroxyacid dehydrogenase [Kiritimatiellae bacterium]|nr:D-2-hydroxyacid dehydrogenase [Kiritimatiellia bacterium]
MMRLVVFQENTIPCFAIEERHIRRLRDQLPGFEVCWCRTEESFHQSLPKAVAAFTWRWEEAWYDTAPNLRKIATPAAGHDFFPPVKPPQVQIHHGSYHGEFMSETLLGMMLAFNRGILPAYRLQLAGDLWPRTRLPDVRSIRNTHAVFLGIGHVAAFVAAVLKPFGIRITAFCRHPVRAARPACFDAGDRILSMDALDAVLPETDHLVLILPGDTETDRLLDARRIALLPKHAVIYNIGRGNCIDEAALAAALDSGAIRGACLDVFAEEPLTDASLLAQDRTNLLRLPHASAFDPAYMDRFLDEAIPWLQEGLP